MIAQQNNNEEYIEMYTDEGMVYIQEDDAYKKKLKEMDELIEKIFDK